jgi:hypothetical protein
MQDQTHLRWVCLARRKLTNAAELAARQGRAWQGKARHGAATLHGLRPFLLSELNDCRQQATDEDAPVGVLLDPPPPGERV